MDRPGKTKSSKIHYRQENRKMHKLISAYGKKTTGHGITFTDKSLTKQSFTKECDINTILAKYQKTGAIDHVNKHEAQYGFATSDTFTESMQIVAKGNTMFEELPSSIRTKSINHGLPLFLRDGVT